MVRSLHEPIILAAGLTPAWQRTMVFDVFHPGGVNRASEVHECASGKVLNVAMALQALGAETRSVSFAVAPCISTKGGVLCKGFFGSDISN